MGLWLERVVHPIMDRTLGTPAVDALREETLADARGRVLEIGFGSGLSLPFYPDAVTELVALDPSPGRRARASARIAASRLPVRFEELGAEALPFEDASFDTVTSAFTLCSIDDDAAALAEVRRVLRPGGAFLFLEHGLAPTPRLQRLQRWLSPVNGWIADGCQLTKDPTSLVAASGLRVEKKRSFYLDEAPRVLGWLTIGRAVR